MKINNFFSYYKHDCIIRLIESKNLEFEFLYHMFKNEIFVLDKYINNNIVKEFICNNQFEIVFLVLFIRKFEKKNSFICRLSRSQRYYNQKSLFIVFIQENSYTFMLN